MKKANNDLLLLAAATVVIVAAFVVMTGFAGREAGKVDLTVLGAQTTDSATEAEFVQLSQDAAAL